MGALCSTKTVTLKHLVDVAGPALTDVQAVGVLLGMRSARLVQRSLELWRQKLPVKEKSFLLQYGEGGIQPDPADAVPDLHLSPGFTDCSGPLLTVRESKNLTLQSVEKKTHELTECRRLTGFCSFLTGVFNLFGVVFSCPVFICGVRHNKNKIVNF